jgi:hypothetical protein
VVDCDDVGVVVGLACVCTQNKVYHLL